eukprot:3046200-Pyramimonas_sp.AAC.1
MGILIVTTYGIHFCNAPEVTVGHLISRDILSYYISRHNGASSEAYASIGGGSPLRKITEDQAEALKEALDLRGHSVEIYVGMR